MIYAPNLTDRPALTLCCATILVFCDIENDIRRFGEEFMVEIYRQHWKPKYHLKAYESSIAIKENNITYFQFLGHMT